MPNNAKKVFNNKITIQKKKKLIPIIKVNFKISFQKLKLKKKVKTQLTKFFITYMKTLININYK